MISANTILRDRYRIVQQLSKGGMGNVYQAIDENLNCVIAVKEAIVTSKRDVDAFKREAQLLANLNHPTLPRVTDYFVDGDREFLVMQFVPGNDLADLMTIRERPFDLKQVLNWADSLLDALDELHSRKPPIIHRDIKPANLKLTPTGRIILLDFGLAKGSVGQMSTLSLDESGYSIQGYTKHYAPPEQMRNAGTDCRSDLYSLGATLWSLLTAKLPPDALLRVAVKNERRPDPLREAHEINQDVPAEISSVLRRAMSLNRSHRPSSAMIMKELLREAVQRSQEGQEKEERSSERQGDSAAAWVNATSQSQSRDEKNWPVSPSGQTGLNRRPKSNVDTFPSRRVVRPEPSLAATQPSIAKSEASPAPESDRSVRTEHPLGATLPSIAKAESAPAPAVRASGASANPVDVHTMPAQPNVLYSKDDLPVFNVGPSGPLPPGFVREDVVKQGNVNAKIDEAIARGNNERERKNYAEAEREYQRALLLDPSGARVYYALGNLYFEQGRFQEAMRAYMESVRIKPDDAVARKNLATAYEAQHRYAEAIEQYQEAVRLDPGYAHAYQNLGQVYTRERRFAEAVIQFQKAIEIEPDYARAHNGLGNVYYQQKNYAAASEKFRRAIQLDPNYVHAYANLGNVYYAEQRYSEAIEMYQRTIELNPQDAHAYANLGNVYFTQKRYEAAERYYSRAMELESQTAYLAYLFNNLGRVYYAQQRYSAAIEQFKRAIEMDPTHAGAYYSLGLTYLIINEKPAAVEQYEKLLTLNSNYAHKLLRELNKVSGVTDPVH